MKKIKELFSNPIVKRISIVVGVFILILIVIIVAVSCAKRNPVFAYEQLETEMVKLTKKRYSLDKYKDKLPKNDKDSIEVSLQSFVDDGTFKDIQSLTAKKSACSGYVKIINNYGNYLYIPYLDCGNDYKSKTIYEVLTDENNIVNSGNGLYHIGNEYIYKGDTVNNYLSLNGILYRILRINEDGTIRVLDTTKRDSTKWDDRYNIDKKSAVGINDYVHDGVNSRIKDRIEYLYSDDNVFNEAMRSYFVSTPVCVGKRSINDDIFDKNIECSSQIDAYPFSLILPYEFYQVSLDANCKHAEDDSCLNYNYLLSFGNYWTNTADRDVSYRAFKIANKNIMLSTTNTTSSYKIVTTLNKELLLESGDGTIQSPYIIKVYDKAIKVK